VSAARLDVRFENRDFTPRPPYPLHWRVEKLRWSDPGGPDTAVLVADNLPSLPAAALHPSGWLGSGVLDLVRCPVLVLADGAPCWWGWVEQVVFQVGALGLQVDLARMINRVAVRYRRLSPAGVVIAEEQTGWADEPVSQERYGVKEALLRMQSGTAEAALETRDAWLKERAFPRDRVLVAPHLDDRLVLHCRGWFQTLDWVHYQPGIGLEEHALPGGTVQAVGSGLGDSRVAQSFTPAADWQAGEAWLRLGKTGLPADAVQVQLCADSAGSPGMVLASATRPAADLASELAWTGFSFAAPVALGAGIPFWVVVSRTGAVSAASHYRAATDAACGYAGGQAKLYNGAAWVLPAAPVDLNFRVVGVESAAAQFLRIPGTLAHGTPGQFLAGVRVEGAAGARLPAWRDGTSTAGAELRRLLEVGDPCRVEVTPERWLAVSPRPEPVAACRVGLDGTLKTLEGAPLPLGRVEPGVWAAFSPALRSTPVYLPVLVWTPRSGLMPVLR